MKTIDVLHALDSDIVEDLVEILNRNGIVSDEDGSCLDSTMIEYWNDECDSFLRAHGYHGGELESTGNYFDFHGAVYALYDSGYLNYEKAQKYIARLVREKSADYGQ